MILFEKDTVLVLWTATLDKKVTMREGDFMAIIASDNAGKLKGEYRFRYSTTAGFDDNDEISRYQVSADDSPEGRERGISAFREMMKYGFNDVIETTINGDFRALQAALLDREGWIMKMEEIPLPAVPR